jgi:hypothetical protein
MNVHSLYITRSKGEREYFYNLLEYIRKFSDNYIKIIHLDFNWDDTVSNIKFNEHRIIADVYTGPKPGESTNFILETVVIYNFENLVNLFKFEPNGMKNAFVYSGHSNGINLMKHNIRILRVEDFCELSYRTLKQKADVIIFDCCLCGNISVLNIALPFAEYLIASSSYWSHLSILHCPELYYPSQEFVETLLNAIMCFIYIEKNTKKTFTTNVVLYHLNDSVKELVDMVLLYKNEINGCNYVIDKRYYKDIYCVFKDLGINIQNLLNKFVLFKRFDVKKCNRKIKSKKANNSWPSELSIILKNPTKDSPEPKASLFFQNR